jgi:exopolyphosphatase/guanosine-5'-triphosphate,3'-diphosphate pyrophosphatase
MRHAIIDLGTNTFHLLIAERGADGSWQFIHRQRVYVRLAEDGIHRIGPAPFDRALKALQGFKSQLDAAGVPSGQVKALGTAALRTADNAGDFLQQAFELTGLKVESISGDREAELIYKGVRRAVPFPDNRVLIMDIGGGSVEFILADRERVFWQQSFPIGVAVLFRNFHKSDPISEVEVGETEQFIESSLTDLWNALAQYPTPTLIGASGTFDVIDLFLLDPATKPELYGYIALDFFYPLSEQFIRSTIAERRAMPKLHPERADMVVVALILIRVVLRKAGISEIYTSTYAMKEGMLEELFTQ